VEKLIRNLKFATKKLEKGLFVATAQLVFELYERNDPFLGKTPLLPLKFIHLNLVKVAWNKCLVAAPHIMSKPALIKAYEYAS
jgi:hypothetical protein